MVNLYKVILIFVFAVDSFYAHASTHLTWADNSDIYHVDQSNTINIDDPINTKFVLSTFDAGYTIKDSTPSNIDGGYFHCENHPSFVVNDGWEFKLEFTGELGNFTCDEFEKDVHDPTHKNHSKNINGNLVLVKTKSISSNKIILPPRINLWYASDRPHKPLGKANYKHFDTDVNEINVITPTCSADIYYNGGVVSEISLDTISNWKTLGGPPFYPGKIFSIRPSNEVGCDSAYQSSADIKLISPTITDVTTKKPSLITNDLSWGFSLIDVSTGTYWGADMEKNVTYRNGDLISFNVNYYRRHSSADSGNLSTSAIFNVTFK
ncbi:TPA: hypothetical protein ACX6Q1_001074 [Photobacterium damselae]